MGISSTSVRKLMNDSFSQKNPMQVKMSDRETLAAEIKDRLAGLTYVTITDKPAYYRSDEEGRFITSFAIEEPSRYRYSFYDMQFRLLVDEEGQLQIRSYSNSSLVSSVDEIVDFVINCQERVDRRQAQKSKRQKVRNFKEQAIIAQIKKIAREERFAFYTDTDSVKLKLFIRLSENDSAQIDIPFKTFQQVLSHLRPTIKALMMLKERNIKVKLHAKAYGRWTEPEMLDNEQQTLE